MELWHPPPPPIAFPLSAAARFSTNFCGSLLIPRWAGRRPTLLKQPWREVVQTPAPRQPFMRRSRRLEINVVDPGLGEFFTEILGARALDRPDSQEQHLHLFIECRGIGKH